MFPSHCFLRIEFWVGVLPTWFLFPDEFVDSFVDNLVDNFMDNCMHNFVDNSSFDFMEQRSAGITLQEALAPNTASAQGCLDISP